MIDTYPRHILELIAACRQNRGLDPRDVLDAIDDPQWERACHTNDWRSVVVDSVVDIWPFLGVEARLVAYLTASVEVAIQ